ncbi:MAG: preprotein translocase subunit SecD [Frankiaceae bacterium]|jgi:preprotein translocase subunit SecD|nr:preprotein translocase subunit SecD [Frankiaceae bacterium]
MLAIVGAVVVALYLGLFLGPAQTPKLGLDLRGGTQVVLTATPLAGGKVTKQELSQAVDIIRQRVLGAGVGGATVNTQGNANIVVSAPGANRRQLGALDQTALLNFRLVLGEAAGTGPPVVTTPPSASVSPTPKTTPKKSAAPKKKKSSHDVVAPALLKASTSPTPSATTSPSPSASPSPSVETKKPVPGSASTDVTAVQKVFASYDCVNGVNKTQPTLGVDKPEDYIVACDKTGSTKYLLAPASVKGSDIGSANAVIDTTTNQWKVQVNFSGSGKNGWFELTKKAYEADPSQSPATCATINITTGCNSIAITLDGVVQSAPGSVQDGIPGGQTEITGNFTQDEASTLANVLKYGALPLKLVKQTESSVSASLGSEQLRGGLIAGMIGLGLVIVYSLLYYRALGLVTVASLALSGLVLYAVTTLLGHSSLGYTLSLPGIAGFIVAVGITADSFVVFFERLRDEVRDGKRLRSAVERAWPRARRTIISADAVSLLAAVVLYIVSIGDVRGFAFTLGLSTLSDLFVVFCFTKPLLALLARTKTFDAGHGWTGVGGTGVKAQLEPREA